MATGKIKNPNGMNGSYQIIGQKSWEILSSASTVPGNTITVTRTVPTISGATHYLIYPSVFRGFIPENLSSFISANQTSQEASFRNISNEARTLSFSCTVVGLKYIQS